VTEKEQKKNTNAKTNRKNKILSLRWVQEAKPDGKANKASARQS
jgi:hypothetical protein